LKAHKENLSGRIQRRTQSLRTGRADKKDKRSVNKEVENNEEEK
jgi:hypothetical protein